MIDGTPRTGEACTRIDGKQYHVLIQRDGRDDIGRRAWQERLVSSQGAEPQPFTIECESWHDGCGFSFDTIPHVYEYAHKWDASAPGVLRTWDIDTATGPAWTTETAHKGWAMTASGFLYFMKSDLVKKVDPSDWGIEDTEDLPVTHSDTSAVVAGRPGRLNSKLYVPLMDRGNETLEEFYEITIAASGADTYAAGPTGKEARSFIDAQQDRAGRLFRALAGQQIASVAVAPVTAGNWSDDGSTPYEAGFPGERVTDMVIFDRYLMCLMSTGLHTFDETLFFVNEIPGITNFADNSNGVGTEAWQDIEGPCIVIPHRQTDLRWTPGRVRPIGPAFEGGLETSLSPDVQGRTWGQVQYFPWLFQFKEDLINDDGYVIGLHPGHGRRKSPPHCFFRSDGGRYEAGTLYYDAAADVMWLALLHANTAGTSNAVHLVKLPRGVVYPSGDERVDHAVFSAAFSTPRYAHGDRMVQKLWHSLDLHLTLSPLEAGAVTTPGFQVWASIENGAFFQLQDGAGAVKTAKTNGRHEFFFPAAPASVGRWCQLQLRVPADGGTDTALDVTVRNMKIHGMVAPEMRRSVEATLVLGPGEYLDKGSARRTIIQQRADLRALAGPAAAPVQIIDPWNDTWYGKITSAGFREIAFKGTQTRSPFVAAIQIEEELYS